jgi:hypothetical protein
MPERRVLSLASELASELAVDPKLASELAPDPMFVQLSPKFWDKAADADLVDSEESAGLVRAGPGSVRRFPPGLRLDAADSDDVVGGVVSHSLADGSVAGARSADASSDAITHPNFLQKRFPLATPLALMQGPDVLSLDKHGLSTSSKAMSPCFHDATFAEAVPQASCLLGSAYPDLAACGLGKSLPMPASKLAEHASTVLEMQSAAPSVAPRRLIRALV